MSKLLVFQVDGMDGFDEGDDTFAALRDIGVNARLRNLVEEFLTRSAVASDTPRPIQYDSSASIAASSSASTGIESGAAPVSGDSAVSAGAGGSDTGLELSACGPGLIPAALAFGTVTRSRRFPRPDVNSPGDAPCGACSESAFPSTPPQVSAEAERELVATATGGSVKTGAVAVVSAAIAGASADGKLVAGTAGVGAEAAMPAFAPTAGEQIGETESMTIAPHEAQRNIPESVSRSAGRPHSSQGDRVLSAIKRQPHNLKGGEIGQ